MVGHLKMGNKHPSQAMNILRIKLNVDVTMRLKLLELAPQETP